MKNGNYMYDFPEMSGHIIFAGYSARNDSSPEYRYMM